MSPEPLTKPTPEILSQLIPHAHRIDWSRATVTSVGGGCISNAYRVEVPGAESYFVKSNTSSFESNFQAECEGLVALAEASESIDSMHVPRPLEVHLIENQSWLILPWVERTNPPMEFFESFGRGLAQLHRQSLGSEIGWANDNYLGAAKQINSPADNWPDFVAENRLGYQWKWAVDQGAGEPALGRRVEAIIDKLDQLLDGRDRSTSLLHGDLWSGNYWCDEAGRAVLVDPAIYRGCREAEFGMIRLFGACPTQFDRAYQDEFPMPDGYARRIQIYVLYHLLNHLNLFGTTYHAQCLEVADEILRS